MRAERPLLVCSGHALQVGLGAKWTDRGSRRWWRALARQWSRGYGGRKWAAGMSGAPVGNLKGIPS